MAEVFTPVQLRILGLLSDGFRHSKVELKRAADDEWMSDNALAVHICTIRKVLKPRGQDVLCITASGGYPITYQHVRLLRSSHDS